MGGLNDNEKIGKSLNELVAAFEENIIIKRWTSYSTDLPAEGVTPAGNYTSIAATAVVDDIGIEKLMGKDGMFASGDLQFQTRVLLLGEILGPAGTMIPGDRILYDGGEYKLVQKPMIEFLSGVVYYTCIGRRIND